MEWNISFLQKNILAVCVYTSMSSYFLCCLGKKDGEDKLQMCSICLMVVIFLSETMKAFNAVNICALNKLDVDQGSGVSFCD